VAFVDFKERETDDLRGGYLLGGWANGKWLKDREAAAVAKGGEPYRLYALTGEIGAAVGGKPHNFAEAGDPCHETLTVVFPPVSQARRTAVAVGGLWNAQPRRPRLLSTDQQVYRRAAAEILQKNGIVNPQVKLTQVIRVDLDGDGAEEVLVAATNYKYYETGSLSPNARAGDYSLVFLRQVLQGKVVTSVLAGEYYPRAKTFNASSEHKVGAIVDLNGDGRMEVVLFGRYYEGDWAEAYQIQGAKVTKLFGTGCGV
jgi:hypothetical protein